MKVLNLGHSPLYRHFCKCLHIEFKKNHLIINSKVYMKNTNVECLMFYTRTDRDISVEHCIHNIYGL